MRYARIEHDFVVDVQDTASAGFVPVEDFQGDVGKRTHTITQGRARGVYVVRCLDAQELETRINRHWSDVRAERNGRLAECDWTQLPDSPLTTEQRTAWQTYRQALRDITGQLDPFSLEWPNPPVS